jgi:hypothetical protein
MPCAAACFILSKIYAERPLPARPVRMVTMPDASFLLLLFIYYNIKGEIFTIFPTTCAPENTAFPCLLRRGMKSKAGTQGAIYCPL